MAGDFQEEDVALNSGSISFGRFEKEELSWEKRSSFSHNKYIEEAGQCSKPGSVGAKKAYFEAHFKKKGILFPGVLGNQSTSLYRSTCIPENKNPEVGDQELAETAYNDEVDATIPTNNGYHCEEVVDCTYNSHDNLYVRGQGGFESVQHCSDIATAVGGSADYSYNIHEILYGTEQDMIESEQNYSDIVPSVGGSADKSHCLVEVGAEDCQPANLCLGSDEAYVMIENQEGDIKIPITNSDTNTNEVFQIKIQRPDSESEYDKTDNATSFKGKNHLEKSIPGIAKLTTGPRLKSLASGSQVHRNVNKHDTKVSSGSLKHGDRLFLQQKKNEKRPAVSEMLKTKAESSSLTKSEKGPNSGKVLTSSLNREKDLKLKSLLAGKRPMQNASTDKPKTDERSEKTKQVTESEVSKLNRNMNSRASNSSQPGTSGIKIGSSNSKAVSTQRREGYSKSQQLRKGTEPHKWQLATTSSTQKVSREAGASIKSGHKASSEKAVVQTEEGASISRSSMSRMKNAEQKHGAGSTLKHSTGWK